MTLSDRIERARWYLQAIEAKAGSPDHGPLEVALCDCAELMKHVHAIGVELGARKARVGR